MIHIILLEPEIPQNTGNISRTCAVTGAHLHLIGPMGFSIEDRWLKRAGLDYWDQLSVYTYDSWEDFKAKHPNVRPWMASSKAAHSFCDVVHHILGQISVNFLSLLQNGNQAAGLGGIFLQNAL